MGEEHSEVSMQNIYFLEKQDVVVKDFDAPGLILAIGGGGEGVIGQLKGAQVVAIDRSVQELQEAAQGPLLKIKMSAEDLQFLDESFGAVTSFFTLMYIKASLHEQVFKEIYRVLAPQGRLLVWDVNLPTRLDETKEIVAVRLNIKLPDREIETGYGTRWPEQLQNLAYFKALAEGAGFIVLREKEDGQLFYLELQKP